MSPYIIILIYEKYLFVAVFLCTSIVSTELYAQKTVILSADNNLAHIQCLGTTTVSGPNSVVYGYKDMFNLRQTIEHTPSIVRFVYPMVL